MSQKSRHKRNLISGTAQEFPHLIGDKYKRDIRNLYQKLFSEEDQGGKIVLTQKEYDDLIRNQRVNIRDKEEVHL